MKNDEVKTYFEERSHQDWMTGISTKEEFQKFMEIADGLDNWDCFEPEEWTAACEYAGLNYEEYDDPDRLWNDLKDKLYEVEHGIKPMSRLIKEYGLRFNETMLDQRDFYAREEQDKGFYLVEMGRNNTLFKIYCDCVWEDGKACPSIDPIGYTEYGYKKDEDNDLIY